MSGRRPSIRPPVERSYAPDREASLEDEVNVLRESLVNHAEFVYKAHGKADKADIKTLLRDLAFKDPNTGLYSQQRVMIDGDNRERLLALVKDGFGLRSGFVPDKFQ